MTPQKQLPRIGDTVIRKADGVEVDVIGTFYQHETPLVSVHDHHIDMKSFLFLHEIIWTPPETHS